MSDFDFDFAENQVYTLGVGSTFPAYEVDACTSIEKPSTAFEKITNNSYEGKWKIYFFWPKDFTFICPTEIAEFGKLNEEFQDRDAQILGCSTDSEFVHFAWRKDHDDLRDLPFPMLADVKREISESLGILDKDAGVCQRATYVVDPQGIVRHVSINDLSVGRNPKEILRILDGLQSDELCPCNWEKGEDTIDVDKAA